MTTGTDRDQILSAPRVDPDDIEQEYQLLLLQGKKPSRRILFHRALRYESLLFDFTAELSGASEISWAESPIPSAEVYERLTSWALAQSEVIQNSVFDFLEEPSEDKLNRLFKDLRIKEPEQPKPNKTSLSDAILNYCTEPRSLPELYQLSRRLIFSERPEAAVRQTVRRLLKNGKLERSANVYRIS